MVSLELQAMILNFLKRAARLLFGPRYHPERHYMRGARQQA
jgi:hypothetical protein